MAKKKKKSMYCGISMPAEGTILKCSDVPYVSPISDQRRLALRHKFETKQN